LDQVFLQRRLPDEWRDSQFSQIGILSNCVTEPSLQPCLVEGMKTRKQFHPAASTVRRFAAPLKSGYAQRKKLRNSVWYNSAQRQVLRLARPILSSV